jgi:hypothetical protein
MLQHRTKTPANRSFALRRLLRDSELIAADTNSCLTDDALWSATLRAVGHAAK